MWAKWREKEMEEEDGDRKEEADIADWKGMEKRIQNLEDAIADLKKDKEPNSEKVEEVDTDQFLNFQSRRGTGGFGSTGDK